MILSQIEDRLVAWYISSAAKKGAAIYLLGDIGLGKTDTLSLFPEKMKPFGEFGMVILNGACLNLGTIGGYMNLNGKTYRGKAISEFSLPWWWFIDDGSPELKGLEDFDGGVIFIDEADKIGIDEKKIVGEAALSKVLMTHKLPPGWVVWFAANRMIDRSGSTKDLDHLIGRRRTIEVRNDTESWAEWARKMPLLPEVISFGESNPQLLFEPKPEIQGPWCNPRSLHAANVHFEALMEAMQTDIIPTDPITEEEISGGIGNRAGPKLMVHIREGYELPKYENAIAFPNSTMIPDSLAYRRLMSYRMGDKLKPADVKNALLYMGRFEEEFQVIFVKLAISKNPKIVLNDQMAEWAGEKSSLIAVIDRYK